MQTRHFLHVIVPPGCKTYQAGFTIFSSKEFNLRDIFSPPGDKMREGRREGEGGKEGGGGREGGRGKEGGRAVVSE